MKNIELLEQLRGLAICYRRICIDSINKNKHLNELNGDLKVDQKIIDAILVDYINYTAYNIRVDYGMHTSDLID